MDIDGMDILGDDCIQERDAAVEGDRNYSLENLHAAHSDGDSDADAEYGSNPTKSADKQADGGGCAEPMPSAFLLQAAKEEDELFKVLPHDDLVDEVFSPASPVSQYTNADCERFFPLRQMLQEDLLMMDLFFDRLHTPVFRQWVDKDPVILRDLRRAALDWRGKLHRRIGRLLVCWLGGLHA